MLKEYQRVPMERHLCRGLHRYPLRVLNRCLTDGVINVPFPEFSSTGMSGTATYRLHFHRFTNGIRKGTAWT